MKASRQLLRLLIGRRPPAMQVGAVCRCTKTGRVVLITSRGTGRWVIPKGWPMAGKTLSGAAATEAWEESGVKGHVHHTEIGRYHYEKEQDGGWSVPIEVRVFLLDIDSLRSEFPEAKQRQRCLFTPEEAAQRVSEAGLKDIMLALRTLPG